MVKILIVLAFVFGFHCAVSQHQNDHWLFEYYNGIRFVDGYPKRLDTVCPRALHENVSTISHPKTGELQFYVGGACYQAEDTIKYPKHIEYGEYGMHLFRYDHSEWNIRLKGNASARNGVIIIPDALDTSVFHIITMRPAGGTCEWKLPFTFTSNFRLFWSTIQLHPKYMNRTSVNSINLIRNSTGYLPDTMYTPEYVSATPDCEGTGYWVVTRSDFGMIALHLTTNGLDSNYVFTPYNFRSIRITGSDYTDFIGSMKFSPNGKYCYVLNDDFVMMWNFDNKTGMFSKPRNLYKKGRLLSLGSFSANSKYLYVYYSDHDARNRFYFYNHLGRFISETGEFEEFGSIADSSKKEPYAGARLELGYNGNMYFFHGKKGDSTASIGYIKNLDSGFSKSNIVYTSVQLQNSYSGRFQNNMQHWLSSVSPDEAASCAVPKVEVFGDTLCEGECKRFRTEERFNPVQYTWMFEQGTPNSFVGKTPPEICYAQAGTYAVRLIACNNNGCDTTVSNVIVVANPQISTEKTISICVGDSVTLRATGASRYKWIEQTTATELSNSDTVRVHPTTPSTYVVTGYNTRGCQVVETVEVLPGKVRIKTSDTTVCQGTTVTLKAIGAQEYEWRNLSSNEVTRGNSINIIAQSSTRYQVIGTSGTCSDTSFATLTVETPPEVQAQGAATVCTGTQVTLTVANADSTTRYEWFNEQGQSIGTSDTLSTTPEKTSWYYVHAQRGTCIGRDSVQITVNNALSVEVQQDIAVCKGDGFTLTIPKPEQGATYTWKELNNQAQTKEGITYTGATNATVANALTFEVHGVRSGCEGKDTVRVRINALPILTTQDVEVCVGSLATLTSTSSDSLQTQEWKDAQGTVLSQTSKLSVQASAEATYTYTATNRNGCTSSVTAKVRTKPKVQLSTRVDARAGGTKNEREVEERFTIPFYVQSTENYNKQVQVTVRTEAEAFEIAGTTLESVNGTGYHSQTFTLPSVTQGETKVGEWNVRALLTQVRVPRFRVTLNFAENDDCRIATASVDSVVIVPVCVNDFRQIVLLKNMLTIAPNPVGEELHLSSDEEMQSLDLHNALGEKVLTSHLGCKDCTLSTKELSNGVYQATVHFAGGSRTKMVVISK